MKVLIMGIIVPAVILIVSCNQKSKTQANLKEIQKPEEMRTKNESEFGNAIADTASAPVDQILPTKQKGAAALAPADWDRKIVKTANVEMEVADFAAYNDWIHKNLRPFGGYIASENQSQAGDRLENNMEVKVPVDRFEDAMQCIVSSKGTLKTKNISSEDVTTRMLDIKARIEAKKQVRLQYMELLKQSHKMSDILEVEREINSMQEEIESASSQVGYLAHASAFSTIHFTFFQLVAVADKTLPYESFWYKLKTAFGSSWQMIQDIILFLVSLWPILVIGLAGWAAWKKRSKSPAKLNG